MNTRGFDFQMVMGPLGRSPQLMRARRGADRNNPGALSKLVWAKLSERILRPATLSLGSLIFRRAHRFLLTEFARRQSVAMTKGPAEMRGVTEAAPIRDFGDRAIRFRRIGKIAPCPLQPALANIMAEIVTCPFKQLLQITFGNSFHLRHARRSELGIVKPALDRLADSMQERRLCRAARRVGCRCCKLMRECQEKIGETLRYRGPFRIAEAV